MRFWVAASWRAGRLSQTKYYLKDCVLPVSVRELAKRVGYVISCTLHETISKRKHHEKHFVAAPYGPQGLM